MGIPESPGTLFLQGYPGINDSEFLARVTLEPF
jgi:hypothetical protein